MVDGSVQVSAEIASHFKALSGVSDVVVKEQHPQEFMVEIYLAVFESKIRRSVYAQERELYKQFPKFAFDFVVIDDSHKPDAATFEG
jgi:hypothetical protein